jgi:TldD protein
MDRRKFIQMTGMGLGAFAATSIPIIGQATTAELMAEDTVDIATKKKFADIALNAARSKGATYTDVRIGRYLQQYLFTRETRVQNIVNAESYGVGIRVIANGTWGFAATSDVSADGIARCAETAVAIAKANSKMQTEPVILAPQKGVGEVTWNTPIQKNAFQIPVQEKIDLLMKVNGEAMKNGAAFVTSNLFFINEQKYFASTDGSYIDQDVHRIWPTFTVTAIQNISLAH